MLGKQADRREMVTIVFSYDLKSNERGSCYEGVEAMRSDALVPVAVATYNEERYLPSRSTLSIGRTARMVKSSLRMTVPRTRSSKSWSVIEIGYAKNFERAAL
jgi:hypothetical protein